jgi:hypothetical protein
MKEGHDIETDIPMWIGNDPHHHSNTFCVAEIHHFLQAGSAGGVHGFQMGDIRHHPKTWIQIRQKRSHLFKATNGFPDPDIASIGHGQQLVRQIDFHGTSRSRD